MIFLFGLESLPINLPEIPKPPRINLEVNIIADNATVQPNRSYRLIIENPSPQKIEITTIKQEDKNFSDWIIATIDSDTDEVNYDDFDIAPGAGIPIDLLNNDKGITINENSTLELIVTPQNPGYEDPSEIFISVHGRYQKRVLFFSRTGRASGEIILTLEP